MFIKTKLNKQIEKLNNTFTKMNINESLYILNNKKQLLIRNLIAGISRGIGIGIGFTVITAIIIYILQRIVRLNIPVIGDFISDVIDIVKNKY